MAGLLRGDAGLAIVVFIPDHKGGFAEGARHLGRLAGNWHVGPWRWRQRAGRVEWRRWPAGISTVSALWRGCDQRTAEVALPRERLGPREPGGGSARRHAIGSVSAGAATEQRRHHRIARGQRIAEG